MQNGRQQQHKKLNLKAIRWVRIDERLLISVHTSRLHDGHEIGCDFGPYEIGCVCWTMTFVVDVLAWAEEFLF